MSMNLAQRFCIDPDAAAYEAPYFGFQTICEDMSAELVFPDGSVASEYQGEGWRPSPISAAEAATLGVTETAEERKALADADREASEERFQAYVAWTVAVSVVAPQVAR